MGVRESMEAVPSEEDVVICGVLECWVTERERTSVRCFWFVWVVRWVRDVDC